MHFVSRFSAMLGNTEGSNLVELALALPMKRFSPSTSHHSPAGRCAANSSLDKKLTSEQSNLPANCHSPLS